MKIKICQGPFDPYREIEKYQESIKLTGQFGATASFIGTMRDFNEGEKVYEMYLDYYEGMTEKHLTEICSDAMNKWAVLEVLVMHRVGRINPGDPIVLVCVWTVHRADAFAACRFIMEDLKSRAPFWKQEKLTTGKRWVGKNTPG